MNKIITLLAILFSLSAVAQKSNLIIFNNSGQQFFVILNGIKQNINPKTNVKIQDLAPTMYKVKIIFADGKTGDIDKNVYVESNMEYSAQVVFKKGKSGKLRLFDVVAINTSPYGNSSEVINYRPNENAIYSDQEGTFETNVGSNNTQSTYNQTTVYNTDGTQTVTTTANGQTTSVTTNAAGTILSTTTSVSSSSQTTNTQTGNASVNGNNGTHTHSDGTVHDQNHNVVNTGNTQINGTHTHSDGTVHDQNHNVVNTGNTQNNGTHTHSDGTVHDQNHNVVNTGNTQNNGTHTHSDGTVHDQNHNVLTTGNSTSNGMNNTGNAVVNANGTLSCSSAVSDIESVITGVKNEKFSSEKMDLVRMQLKMKCINSDQAVRIVSAFTFDGDKIEMAKFCYDHLTDKNNASKMLELFSFSSSKDELKKYFAK